MPRCRLSTGYGEALPEPRRTAPRHSGYADPANPPLGSATRLRDHSGHPCRVAGSFAGGDRIALPCPAPAGEARLGEIGMEADGKQAAGEVLQSDGGGTEAACVRAEPLESDDR